MYRIHRTIQLPVAIAIANCKSPSYLLNLIGLHNRIGLRYCILRSTLVIKHTVMFIGVSVHRAKRLSTPALEPRQPYALPTEAAPIRRAFFGASRGGSFVNSRTRVFANSIILILDNWSLLGLLDDKLFVAFGAEIIGRGASEESAVIGAENCSIDLVFLRFLLHNSQV